MIGAKSYPLRLRRLERLSALLVRLAEPWDLGVSGLVGGGVENAWDGVSG